VVFFLIYTCNHREVKKVAYLWQIVIIPTKYFSCDEIKKNWIGWACDTYCGDTSSMQGFDRETGRKEII